MSFKKKLRYLVPVPVKKTLKYLYYLVQDILSSITGRRLKGYPPKRLNFVGSSEFKKVGDEFREHFIKLGKLKPSDKVLDIGCGIGRMAIPLTGYLKEGELHGFDIDQRGVRWCQKNITPKYPNFQFQYVDIFNKYYNKKGKIHAENFVFPYPDETFDFAFATSVFTHLLTQQAHQYLSEIGRVLKPGGTAFLTWFSIDAEVQKNIADKTSNCDLSYAYDEHAFYSHKNVPEAEIGFQEKWILDQLETMGISEHLHIHRGSWANRKTHLSYQDIFVSQKKKR